MVDRDVADLREAFSAQRHVQSMQESQRSMQETLAEHGRVLARLDPGEDG